MRYGFIAPARALFVSAREKNAPFLRPLFACVAVCHEPLSLLRVTRSFLSIGVYKMDSVHAHLYFMLVFVAKAALW